MIPQRPETRFDQRWMQVAIHEACKGCGTASPNPMVGAVVASGNKLLGKGFHGVAGGPHAEVVALRRCKRLHPGATLYVTLEPCSTHGRTPPCVDLIRSWGIRRVVIGSLDPNPLHHGRGVRLLQKSGIKVITGVAKEACEGLNPAFKKYITKRLPLGVAKMAMSLDGKFSTRTGDSKWISGPFSRRLVQRMRHSADAVLVGAGTVRRDDPRLTLREKTLPPKKRDWVRIVADSRLSVSPGARIFKPAKGCVTWIATTNKALRARGSRYAGRGIELLGIKASRHGISIRDLFRQLGRRQITSVLIEGGPTILASCFEEKVVDRLALFIAPKIVARHAKMKHARPCRRIKIHQVGRDILVEADL